MDWLWLRAVWRTTKDGLATKVAGSITMPRIRDPDGGEMDAEAETKEARYIASPVQVS